MRPPDNHRTCRYTADVVRVFFFWNGIEIERSPGKPVGRFVRSGKENETADFFPVIINGQLLVINRRIGEDFIFPTMINIQLAVNVFEMAESPVESETDKCRRGSEPFGMILE